MLKLNDVVLERYLDRMINADIGDMVSIYELMSEYNNLFVKDGLSKSDKIALDIINKNVNDIVTETFDYRSDNYETNMNALTESLKRLPRCSITEPLFVLHEKMSGIEGNKNLLPMSHTIKSIEECPLDFVLHKMYYEGLIPTHDMVTYKVSLESEVYSLANIIEDLFDDLRVDKDTVPNKPEYHYTEVIHLKFHTIVDIYDNYVKHGFSDKMNDVYRYSCTPSAIVDKIYLCDMDFSGFVGIDISDPVQVNLCQQVSALMCRMHVYLEKLVLRNQDNDIHRNLYRLAEKFVSVMETNPSVTAMVLTKLVICCLMDSIHLQDTDCNLEDRYGNSLKSLIKRVEKVNLNINDKFSINPKCLLNFYYLCELVNRDCNLTDVDINSVVSESMKSIIDNHDDYIYINNMESCSYEAREASMSSLTEMFQVMSDGTIKVLLKEKTTYMNEYAMNHRLLKYNIQQNDYESAKYNIIYHMMLIDSVENEVLYNKKIKKDSDLYKDAEQARRMAKSDIATYLPEIRRHSPSFNMNEMYKRVKADKATITIQGADTASGIKTIFKHILY